MPETLTAFFPNLANYWDIFLDSLNATIQMFLIGGAISFVIGLLFGIGLVVTKKGGLAPNQAVYSFLNGLINIFRSVPFILLLIFLIPFTRLISGTAIGVKGAIVPIVFGCVPFFARQVESALSDIDAGKVEAARAMGSSTAGIIFRVYLSESLPALIRAVTITSISLIGLTTAAGAVGAGGIGSFAINYGQNLHYQDIVNVCVVVLLILICLLQLTGNLLARKATNRKLFSLPKHSGKKVLNVVFEEPVQLSEAPAKAAD